MWLHWQRRGKARSTLAILYPFLIEATVTSKERFWPTFSDNILAFPEMPYNGISSRTSSWWCSPSAEADFIRNLTFVALGSQWNRIHEVVCYGDGSATMPHSQTVILNGFFPSLVWEKHIYLFRSCKDELKMLTNTGLPKGLGPSCTAWHRADV